MLRIEVITIFPDYLDPVRQALQGKAIEAGILDIAVHDLRRWTHDVHRSVDDAPYGGGPGMVMKAPVWGDALDEICTAETLLVVPTPAGRLFDQETAQRSVRRKPPRVRVRPPRGSISASPTTLHGGCGWKRFPSATTYSPAESRPRW